MAIAVVVKGGSFFMGTIETIKPNREERATCRSRWPVACATVKKLIQIEEGIESASDKDWRQELDYVRQAIDNIGGRCETFTVYHQKHGRNEKLERLPCQIARRTIMVEGLQGEWIAHDYTIPVGKK